MRLTFILLVILALVISMQPSINSKYVDIHECKLFGNTSISDPEYIIDQSQIEENHKTSIHDIVWIAQSFKPSLTPLTKVDLKIERYMDISQSLQLSIRKNLNGSELTYTLLESNQIPYYSNWIEFDFPDIEVQLNETYYIVLRTGSPSGQSYIWCDEYSEDIDYYQMGEQWFSNDYGGSWERTSSSSYYIDGTFRTYSYESKEDLYCEGYFNWTDVKPGEIVTGTLSVFNIGTPLSYLSWRISQWPSWGTWTFSKSSGTYLTPEDGVQAITVTVKAPHTDIPDKYIGKITIINQDDPNDYDIIDAQMVTPRTKTIENEISKRTLIDILNSYYIFIHDLHISQKTMI